jgi:hypothetical protein
MHVDEEAGETFLKIWTDLTSDEVTNSSEYRPFFNLDIFSGRDLRALMLASPGSF